MGSGDKTEQATPKRREEERKKGNLFQSRDMTSALGLLAIFLFFRAAAPYVFGWTSKLLKQYLTNMPSTLELTDASASKFLSELLIQSAILSLPFLIVAALIGFFLDAAQTRMNFSLKRLRPDFNRVNPLSGMRKMFDVHSLVELFKSAVKIVITGGIVYSGIKDRIPRLISFADGSPMNQLGFLCGSLYAIVSRVGLAMVAFGIVDYFYQWWSYERQIRMTKQEIKDEYRQSEGDPKIKGRIREQQRRIARMRVIQMVPFADVVVRNPTHYAVAIKYEREKNRAPVVLAKGKDYLALKMVEAAEKAGVAITENPPLARGLYAAVKAGQEIPEEYYKAVAEVLAFVYGLRGGKRIA